MDPMFIDQTIDLRNTGDIDELLTRLEIPSGLLTKIKDSLTFQESVLYYNKIRPYWYSLHN